MIEPPCEWCQVQEIEDANGDLIEAIVSDECHCAEDREEAMAEEAWRQEEARWAEARDLLGF